MREHAWKWALFDAELTGDLAVISRLVRTISGASRLQPFGLGSLGINCRLSNSDALLASVNFIAAHDSVYPASRVWMRH